MRHLGPLLALAVGLPASLFGQSPPDLADRKPEKVELASPEVVVPMEIVKGRPVIEVSIGGKGPFKFVLDTGASGTVLGSELVKELALPESGEVRMGDPINPHAISAKQVKLDRLSLGGATFSGMTATSMDRMALEQHLGARGILGMPAFSDLLLTIDFARREVRIARGELPAADGKDIVAYEQAHGALIRVPITVASIEIAADLDSGSPSGVSLPDAYMEKLPLEGKPVEVGRARTVNSEFVVRGATLKGSVRIGGHVLESPELRFNALPVANVGSQVLARFTITIDQKNRRIRFVSAAQA
jgi:hypothetical protein